MVGGAAPARAARVPPGREHRDRRQPRAVHPRARAGRRGSSAPPGERPRHRARAGDARLLGRLDRARQRLGRSRDGRRARPRPRAAGRGVLRAAARLAHRGGGEGLLLRLLQRGPLAALPHRARAAGVPRGGLARTTSAVNRALRRRGVRGGRRRRPDRPRAGLPLRAGAAADPRAPAARDDHHVLAHPVAERRALRHLPVARRSCSTGCSAPASSASTPSCTATTSSTRSTASSRRASIASGNAVVQRRAQTLVRPYPDLHRVADPLARRRAAGGGVPRSGASRARPARRRAPRRRRRSPRLHQGHRGAAPRRGAAARALPAPARAVHLRAARGAEPHASSTRYRELNERVEALAARINERFGERRLPADRPAPRAPRAAARSSATTAPPTSAT